MKKVIYIIEDLTTYNIHYRYQDPKLIDNKIHKRYSFFYFSCTLHVAELHYFYQIIHDHSCKPML